MSFHNGTRWGESPPTPPFWHLTDHIRAEQIRFLSISHRSLRYISGLHRTVRNTTRNDTTTSTKTFLDGIHIAHCYCDSKTAHAKQSKQWVEGQKVPFGSTGQTWRKKIVISPQGCHLKDRNPTRWVTTGAGHQHNTHVNIMLAPAPRMQCLPPCLSSFYCKNLCNMGSQKQRKTFGVSYLVL